MSDKQMKQALENLARRGVPENTNLWPELSAKLERKSPMTTIRTRPLMVIMIALFILLALSGVVYALGRAFGYIPGVGLVENSNGMRVLVEPVSVTRDGVTLTVTQALVYSDHVQMVYDVKGIAPENDSTTFTGAQLNSMDQSAFCGGPTTQPFTDSDARLRLPDGTLINRAMDTSKYPENIFAAKPAFEVTVPADVTELTMLLPCIPWMRLSAVPENWEVPLKLKYVPAGTVIGQPVLAVTPSVNSSVHDNGITVTLDKVVPQDDRYSFFFTITPDEKKDAALAYFPASASVVDATGQKISLIDMSPPPVTHDVAEPWELQSVAEPAYGPYTFVLDKIFVDYAEDGSNFIEFDMGINPQVEQIWNINQTLHLAGTDVKVISATLVESDLRLQGLPANTQGIKFAFEAADGKTPFTISLMEFLNRGISNGVLPFSENIEPAPKYTLTLIYPNGVPSGKVRFAVDKQTVMVTGNWQLAWASPDQNGVDLLESSRSISSKPNANGVTAELKRVVKLDNSYLFYVHMSMPESRPNFRVIAPVDVSVIDTSGKKIQLDLDGPQVYSARNENLWQFSTKENISEGPLKLVVEKAKAYYSNFIFDAPPADDVLQKLIEEHSFTFDVGADPQVDQTWTLNQEFELGGYKGKVISARAVTVDSKQLPFPSLQPDGSINRGYEFTIQSVDPSIQWNVGMSIDRPGGNTPSDSVDCIGGMDGDYGPTTTHTVTCRGLFNGVLRVSFNEITVLLNNTWEIDWTLPE